MYKWLILASLLLNGCTSVTPVVRHNDDVVDSNGKVIGSKFADLRSRKNYVIIISQNK